MEIKAQSLFLFLTRKANYSGNCSKVFKKRALLSILRAQAIVVHKRLIHHHWLHGFPKKKKSHFFVLVQSHQPMFIFMKRELCKGDSKVAPTALSDRPFWKQRDWEGQWVADGVLADQGVVEKTKMSSLSFLNRTWTLKRVVLWYWIQKTLCNRCKGAWN